MRLFIGGIATESNTFAPLPTGWKGFEEGGIFRGDATRHEPRHFTAPLHEWRRLGEADGHEVLEGLMAAAQPAGTTVRAVYESLRDALVTDLRNAMPVDVILLNLHGAMVAHGYDDCEGDLLAALRAVAGPEVIIGAELDLHCHLTSAMLQHADLLVAYKEYPHVDTVDRARELYRLALAAARGEIKPVTSVHDCRMIGGWHTTREPMAGFVRKMQALEGRDGVLSVSFGHGFAYGDVADVGARIWVITDNDPESGRALAARLGKELFDMRDRTRTSHLGVDDALDRALSLEQGPVVLADTLDNPGAGAAGDSTFILRRMLERGIRSAVSGLYWDPIAAQICSDAGVGASLRLRLGGKLGPASGMPLDVVATVKAVREEHFQTSMAGQRTALGTSVHIEVDGIDVVLITQRSQTFHPDAFTGLGIDLLSKQIVVVKSMQHFHRGFSPIARDILYVHTEGGLVHDGETSPYTKRDGNYWPRVADPFPSAGGATP